MCCLCSQDLVPLNEQWTWYWSTCASVLFPLNPIECTLCVIQRRLTIYVTLRIAHAPGMPGTFTPPPRVSDPAMHHVTYVTHVPWCTPGSLTSAFLWSRWRGKLSGIPGTCTTRNFTYLVRDPCIAIGYPCSCCAVDFPLISCTLVHFVHYISHDRRRYSSRVNIKMYDIYYIYICLYVQM